MHHNLLIGEQIGFAAIPSVRRWYVQEREWQARCDHFVRAGGHAVILGTGTDLIEIARIRDSIERFGDRFLARVYTPDEIAYCRRKVHNSHESFAARFAAKEAAAKALGTGIARGVSWTEIEVTRRPGQRPELRFTGRAAERAAAMGATRMHLTLSHSRELAIAMVLLET